MIKIGLTGGIGSGKSVVATLFEVFGIPVYIADSESKRLTNTSPTIKDQLISLFGEKIYTQDGINKQLLASFIFTDPEYLKQVNRIIHPVVNKDFLEWADRQITEMCVIETAILFESGFDKSIDLSLMVYAPFDLRIERATQRDQVSREEILRRTGNQLPDEIKKKRSDYVIYNDDKQALIPQIMNFILCKI